ncbi:response regulator [Patescibacteria group bacterium]|nr:MAG: response regulator [Patescibacteria group bacterium]
MDTVDKKNSILIIDDDRFLLDMYALKFKAGGCDVDVSFDPANALEKLRKGASPNIILLDVVMPSMSGFEFLEAVRKENLAKDASVIMLSNQGSQEDIDKAMQLGAAGYIIKASSIPSEVLEKALSIAKERKK